MSRGVDGLTIEELRSSRAYWWDDQFTRVLLDAIPASARMLVEIGSGLAQVAHALLPHRTELRYIGIDLDQRRLAAARSDLAATAYGPRSPLVRAAGERLPLVDGSADVVLTVVTLQHIADVGAVLREARRALAPDGLLVAVEPDHLAHRWYFDGLLGPITAAFAALTEELAVAKLPADLTVGPRLPALLRDAEFRRVDMRAHCLQSSGHRTAGEVAAELLEHVDSLAATAGAPCVERASACKAAVDRWLHEVGPQTRGQFAWLVPVFLSRGSMAP